MSRFVRASKYRHVFGTAYKRELCYDNLKVSRDAHDSNFAKVNGHFVAVNWQASGGGAFAVIPLDKANFVGKLPVEYPLCTGHTAPVLDIDFNPFNDYVIASGSEDCKVMVWSIPENGLKETLSTPSVVLTGHGRKVGGVLFHPTAENVLATSSFDLTIKLWDVEKGVEKQELTGHLDNIQSFCFNYNGSLIATTCKDKKVRLFDVRSNSIVQEAEGHQGVKGCRVVWQGDSNRFVTTGFSKTSDRQFGIWDSQNLAAPLKIENLDTSSGIIIPYYDNDTKMLYFAGKGDGNIRYFEVTEEDPYAHYLSEYKSSEPQRGIAFMPKRNLNVTENEVCRAFKVTPSYVEPISFKSDIFQHDIFPRTVSGKAPLTCDQFFSGSDANPILISLENGFQAEARKEFVTSAVVPTADELKPPTDKECREGFYSFKKENTELKNELAQKAVRVRQLEAQLESLGVAPIGGVSRSNSREVLDKQ